MWRVVGGSGDDTLIGNALGNSIYGGPGNDTLIGGDGDDNYDFDADEPSGHDTILTRQGRTAYGSRRRPPNPYELICRRPGPR